MRIRSSSSKTQPPTEYNEVDKLHARVYAERSTKTIYICFHHREYKHAALVLRQDSHSGL